MRVRNVQRSSEEIELQMTPMIDIVFQLLVFFIMTFKIAAPEGDFNIRMPLAAPSQGIPEPDALPPIRVRLTAGSGGGLGSIQFGTRPLRNFEELRQEIIQMLGPNPGPSVVQNTEVELDCDYQLQYQFVIEAITAVSGYYDKETDQVIKLVEKIKFAPPRAG